jgi:hypothetical protein
MNRVVLELKSSPYSELSSQCSSMEVMVPGGKMCGQLSLGLELRPDEKRNDELTLH